MADLNPNQLLGSLDHGVLTIKMTNYVTLNPRFKVGESCDIINMLQAFNHISGKRIKRPIQRLLSL